MSFASTWSGSDNYTLPCIATDPPLSTTALEFLFLLVTSDIRLWNGIDFKNFGFHNYNIGTGASSSVQRHELLGELVAIKQCRLTQAAGVPELETAFDKYLKDLVLELRVLRIQQIKNHPNFIKLLGCGIEADGLPLAFLVLEYSSLGSLDSFLRSRPKTPATAKIKYCRDVASALEALHSIDICHGDIKAMNVLVFNDNRTQEYTAKLSDFGQVIFATSNDARYSLGTPLFNAPEIRTHSAFHNGKLNIRAAKMTDIFSFGLLVWQVLNDGNFYFDSDQWIGRQADVEEKEAFLDALPKDGLCRLAVEYASNLGHLDITAQDLFKDLFLSSLKDDPDSRKESREILQVLNHPAYIESSQNEINLSTKTLGIGEIFTQSATVLLDPITLLRYSLFELFQLGLESAISLPNINPSVQKRVALELKRLTQCSDTVTTSSKAAAAMMLSECYAVGFGVAVDTTTMLAWLYQAVRGRFPSASMQYSRICRAFDTTIDATLNIPKYQDIENELSCLAEDLYMSNRIRRFATVSRQAAIAARTEIMSGSCDDNIHADGWSHYLLVETFAVGELDHLSPTHWGAWLGDEDMFKYTFGKIENINDRTNLGRTPLFYACLAGDAKIVSLLLDNGADPLLADLQGITPLHLCIMFEEDDISSIVQLLLHYGADLEAHTCQYILWRAHDLEMSERPLEWAVQSRNKVLIMSLLESGAEFCGLELALCSYLPEIVDLLLSTKSGLDIHELPSFLYNTIGRPFRHWLYHGKARISCILDTIKALERHGFEPKSMQSHNESSFLFNLIYYAKIEEEVEIVRQLLQRGLDIKGFTDDEGADALSIGISRKDSGSSSQHVELLTLLIEQYSAHELNQHLSDGSTYLMKAVCYGSFSTSKILLEHGADVNLCSQEGVFKDTPLRALLRANGSPQTIDLLLKHGADVDITSELLGHEPLLTIPRFPSAGGLDYLLNQENPPKVIFEALEQAVLNASTVYLPTDSRSPIDTLKILLCHEKIFPYINEKDEYNRGLLHLAALLMSSEIIRCLIDAGVHSDTVSSQGTFGFTPLHILLFTGRVHWNCYINDPDEELPRSRKNRVDGLELACLLLEEYHNLQNGWFEGITALHIAAYFGDFDSVLKLIESNVNVDARGQWLRDGDLITAKDLLVGSMMPGFPYWIPDPCGTPDIYMENKEAGDVADAIVYDYEKSVKQFSPNHTALLTDDLQTLDSIVPGQGARRFSDKRVLQTTHKIFQSLNAFAKAT